METISDIPSKQGQPDGAAGADLLQDTKKRSSTVVTAASSAKAGRRSPSRKIPAGGLTGHGRKGSGSGLEGGNALPKPKPGSSASSMVSYLFYLLCITSLGATIYANIRQSYLEDRLFSLVSIEERLSVLEGQIRDVYSRGYRHQNNRRQDQDQEEASVSDVVRKISLQIAELPRIRRDVSALKLSRATRQVPLPEGDCICPPGECEFVICSRRSVFRSSTVKRELNLVCIDLVCRIYCQLNF